MKAKDLIKVLQEFNKDAEVFILNKKNKGYTIREVMPNYILVDNDIRINPNTCFICLND